MDAAPLELAEVPDLGMIVAMGSSRIEVKGSVLGGLAKVTATSKLVNTADLPLTLPLEKTSGDQRPAGHCGNERAGRAPHNLSLQLFGGFLRTQGTLGLGTRRRPSAARFRCKGSNSGPLSRPSAPIRFP